MGGLTAADMAELTALDELYMDTTCMVSRNIAGIGPSGAPLKPNYQPVAPGSPITCRVADLSRRPHVEEQMVAQQLAGIQLLLLYVPLGTSIKRDDHVTIQGEVFQVIGTTLLTSFSTSIEVLIKAVGATT